jgi:hypothetical protein
MGESVEYRDGVFVAPGPQGAIDRFDTGATTGTALMVRPHEELATIDGPGALATTELPPVGPTGPTAKPAPAAGGAHRAAVATVATALVAALAFGAAAFGGAFGSPSSTSGSARAALGAAAANSAGATSVAFTLSAARSTSSAVTTLVSGSGGVDLKTGTGRLSATVPELSGLVGSGQDSIDAVTDSSSVYLGSPALSSLTGGTRWLRVDLPQGSGSADADSSTLAVLADPSQLLGLLSSIGGPVTTVGNAVIGGVPTTEYRTTVTVSELATRAGLTTGTALGARVAKVLGQLGNSSIPVTAWVGNDGYVRQLSASLDLSRATLGSLVGDLVDTSLSGSTSSQSTSVTNVTVDFSHYGDPVTVAVPPASQVTDVNRVVSSLSGIASRIGHAFSGIAASF